MFRRPGTFFDILHARSGQTPGADAAPAPSRGLHAVAALPVTPRRRHRAVAVQSPHRRTVAARSPHPSTVARPPPHTPGRTAAHGARRRSTLRLTALQRWAAAARQYAAAAEAAARQHAP